ncbi:MAG: protein-disulfide reductase DsbD domain-containing protein [Boseongicola sp.]
MATLTKHYRIVISKMFNLPLAGCMNSFRTIFGVLLALVLSSPFARADIPADIAVASILEGWRDTNGHHYAGMTVRLAPGWKTYWRSPGAAGIPPVFDWAASENVDEVTVAFPVPKVTEQNGIRSIGYDDYVVFPLAVRPNDRDEDIYLRGQILIGVCKDVCVPLEIELKAKLQAKSSERTTAIVSAMKNRPMTAAEAGISDVGCEIVPISDGLRITARIGLAQMGRTEVGVVELTDQNVWVSEPSVRRDGDILIAEADLVPPSAQPFLLSRNDVRITIFGGGRAVDIQGCS